MIKEPKARAAPGEIFEYNNTGFLLLSLIVEKVSGQSFAEFMHDNIFKPLGMNQTVIWDETKPKIEHRTISYAVADNSFRAIDYTSDVFVYGAKGVISTTGDLIKWNEALDSELLVKSASLRLAFSPTKLNNGTVSPYGFGWGIGSDNGLRIVEHPGGYLGYRTNIRRYLTERLTIIVLSNNSQFDTQAITRSIGRIYLGEKMVAPRAKVKLDPAVLNTYVGKYESESSGAPNLIIEITLESGELYITSSLRPKAKLLAESANEFVISETTATVAFNRDSTGRVIGLALKTRMGIINARKL
jgi:CubicO group peptidase (beta-lactamase class C family)